MTREEIREQIIRKRSFLCVGLDTDLERIPAHLRDSCTDPQYEFNRNIIDATIDHAVAYKINTAFYECLGKSGWESMEKTASYLAEHPRGPVFIIADAKRADIGNTSRYYADTFLGRLPFDAITVNPYMGYDSVGPFLSIPGKWAIILALTSNPGAMDFQVLKVEQEELSGEKSRRLFELVLDKASRWGSASDTMFVVGATRTAELQQLRRIVPDHFILIPGVGAQGGSLMEISRLAINKDVGIIVNSSRSIIYASEGEDYAEKAGAAARKLQEEMDRILSDVFV